MCLEVKGTVWKRCRRHDGTHDLDTRAHDRRDTKSESVARWVRISSIISCGTLGVMIVSDFIEVGCVVLKVSDPIQDMPWVDERWAQFLPGAHTTKQRNIMHHNEAAVQDVKMNKPTVRNVRLCAEVSRRRTSFLVGY